MDFTVLLPASGSAPSVSASNASAAVSAIVTRWRAILKQRRHQRSEQAVGGEHPAGPAQHRARQTQRLQCVNLSKCALEAKAVCGKGGPGQMRPQSIQEIDDLSRYRAVILMPRQHNRD